MDKAIAKRQAVERQIVRQFIKEMLAAGFLLNINNGGEDDEFPPTTDAKILNDGIMATDDERIYVYRAGEKRHFAWAYFVYGNDGWDVLCDYTVNLDPLMPETTAMIERLSD